MFEKKIYCGIRNRYRSIESLKGILEPLIVPQGLEYLWLSLYYMLKKIYIYSLFFMSIISN